MNRKTKLLAMVLMVAMTLGYSRSEAGMQAAIHETSSDTINFETYRIYDSQNRLITTVVTDDPGSVAALLEQLGNGAYAIAGQAECGATAERRIIVYQIAS